MPDLRLEREFGVSPDRLFEMISTPDGLLQWFGPEGVELSENSLDFSRKGPWFAVMVGKESGQTFKVSGHVTHVENPRSVGLTWAWHDDNDKRGAESHVTLTVAPTADGARLVLEHRELADAEAVENHEAGWSSSLRKLEKLFQ